MYILFIGDYERFKRTRVSSGLYCCLLSELGCDYWGVAVYICFLGFRTL